MTAAAHDQYLAQAADHLRNAIAGDKPLLAGAQGLRALLTVLAAGVPLDPHLTGETSRLLFAAAPRIAEAAAGRITPEFVHAALGCANAAMGHMDVSRRFDLIGCAAVLEAEIRALHIRDLIATRGQIDLVEMLFRNPVVAAPYLTGPRTIH